MNIFMTIPDKLVTNSIPGSSSAINLPANPPTLLCFISFWLLREDDGYATIK